MIPSKNHNQLSFGMALYMPPKRIIAKEIGSYAAEHAETARSELKKLAKDVDIEIVPKQDLFDNVKFNKFDIFVTDISQRKSTFFKRILNNLPRFQKYEASTVYVYEDAPGKPLYKNIIDEAANLKDRFCLSK